MSQEMTCLERWRTIKLRLDKQWEMIVLRHVTLTRWWFISFNILTLKLELNKNMTYWINSVIIMCLTTHVSRRILFMDLIRWKVRRHEKREKGKENFPSHYMLMSLLDFLSILSYLTNSRYQKKLLKGTKINLSQYTLEFY